MSLYFITIFNILSYSKNFFLYNIFFNIYCINKYYYKILINIFIKLQLLIHVFINYK